MGSSKRHRFCQSTESTIWRWKKHGIDPAARQRYSKLFYQCESPLRAFLAPSCHCATQMHRPSRSAAWFTASACPANAPRYAARRRVIWTPQGGGSVLEYMARSAHGVGRIVSIDECAFSERLNPVYGRQSLWSRFQPWFLQLSTLCAAKMSLHASGMYTVWSRPEELPCCKMVVLPTVVMFRCHEYISLC
jgi:hypothetical protein